MKAVIQRVTMAEVTIEKNIKRKIDKGLMVLVGISPEDSADDAKWLSKKIVNLRIFEDDNNKMNLSVKEINGEIMVVSQFTLFATTKKGNRPGFGNAALPDFAIPLYKDFVKNTEQQLCKEIKTGEFGANMSISLINQGPVTIIIDSKNPE